MRETHINLQTVNSRRVERFEVLKQWITGNSVTEPQILFASSKPKTFINIPSRFLKSNEIFFFKHLPYSSMSILAINVKMSESYDS